MFMKSMLVFAFLAIVSYAKCVTLKCLDSGHLNKDLEMMKQFGENVDKNAFDHDNFVHAIMTSETKISASPTFALMLSKPAKRVATLLGLLTFFAGGISLYSL